MILWARDARNDTFMGGLFILKLYPLSVVVHLIVQDLIFVPFIGPTQVTPLIPLQRGLPLPHKSSTLILSLLEH